MGFDGSLEFTAASRGSWIPTLPAFSSWFFLSLQQGPSLPSSIIAYTELTYELSQAMADVGGKRKRPDRAPRA
jgi:hypothetical protein